MKRYELFIEKAKLSKANILFDSDVFISLESYGAQEFFKELKSSEVNFCYIHDVFLEIMNTKKSESRADRAAIIRKYDFNLLIKKVDIIENTKTVQEFLSKYEIFPSPTDLYLSGMAVSYGKKLLILTANVKDFPEPLFHRVGYVIFNNSKSNKLLSFLEIDKSVLK